MNRIIFYISISSLLLFFSCVEPLPFDPPIPEKLLVVDGYISDQEKDIEVWLTTAAAYGNVTDTNNFNFPVTDAMVTIVGSDGLTWELPHQPSFPGLYKNVINNNVGTAGESYEVVIEWENKTYRSLPDQMPVSVPLDTVRSELVREFVPNEFGIEAERCRYEIRVEFQDPANQPNQYLWRFEYIHEIVTAPIRGTGDKCFLFVEADNQFEVYNDEREDGAFLTDIPIGNIDYDFWHPKYLVDVTQYHLSPEAYRFWRQIEQQREQVGGVFDAPPATIRGNMFCVDDSSEVVYGFFRANSITSNYTLFNRDVSQCDIGPIRPEFCFQLRNSTSQNPPDPRWR